MAFPPPILSRPTSAWTINFPHDVRLNSSYSREFSETGNANIWNVSLTYRFFLPLWRGRE